MHIKFCFFVIYDTFIVYNEVYNIFTIFLESICSWTWPKFGLNVTSIINNQFFIFYLRGIVLIYSIRFLWLSFIIRPRHSIDF